MTVNEHGVDEAYEAAMADEGSGAMAGMAAATKPKVSLLDLTAQLEELGTLVEENEGELTPELDAILHQLVVQDREKIGRIGWMIKNWEADAQDLRAKVASIRETIAQYRDAAEMIDRKKSRLLGYIKHIMDLRGVKELYGTPWDLKVRKHGGKDPVKLRDGVTPESLPKRFQRVTVAADLEAIRADLLGDNKNAQKVAFFGERGSSVRVT